ncbi:hypothetical protein Pcinc_012566 [Petrolisthes cinctipes]|uniref:Uncharacterized protein n=1 Tax=Petrolisthes cinctipes TaxID=88211 RepID=A0AAE1FYJ9_PETCI|nr:hypothetical protein Pcinc_012566 [Petrolisthes cinctipes]
MNFAAKNGLKRRRGELERPAPTEERLEARDDILSILEADWLNLDHINGDLSRVTIKEDEMGQPTLVDTLDELGRELAMDVEKDPKERVELEQLPETSPIIPEVQKAPALDETPVRPTEPSPQLKRKRQRSGQSGDETAVPTASPATTGPTDESQIQLEPWVGGRVPAFIRRKPGRLKIDVNCQLGHSVMRAQFADSTSTQRVQV